MGVPFYFVALKNQSPRPFPGMRDFGMQAMAKYGEEALAAWNTSGREGVRTYVETVEVQSGIRLYFFSGKESVLTDRQAPGMAIDAAARILAGQEDGHDRPPEERWLGRRLDLEPNQAGGPEIIVMKLPEPPPPPPFPPMRHGPWNNILLYSVVAGLVCYFLSRSLTAPILKLREATTRIASGDFSVRISRGLGCNSSEVADLGRDFDTMTERIEGLLLSQKQLLRDISHELRSPLARLNVALELARQRAGEDARQPLERIERESGRLNELIGELLTLTRLESGALELDQEAFELNDLMDMVAEDARYEARSRNRGVKFAAESRVMVHGCRELLRRALENVVRNAVHYTAENSEVEISLVREKNSEGDNRAVLMIRDHGPGVPEALLGHLFEPFYRVAEARDRQSGGSGIGLAIAERAVRLHGGTLIAINAEQGGLIVTVSLPLAAG